LSPLGLKGLKMIHRKYLPIDFDLHRSLISWTCQIRFISRDILPLIGNWFCNWLVVSNKQICQVPAVKGFQSDLFGQRCFNSPSQCKNNSNKDHDCHLKCQLNFFMQVYLVALYKDHSCLYYQYIAYGQGLVCEHSFWILSVLDYAEFTVTLTLD